MGLRSFVLVLGICLGVGNASAKGWPQPTLEQNDSGEIEVLFTFDDGPNPTTTPQVLDILKQHHIHAVFFLVGDMAGSGNKKVPAIIERMLAEGHVIGNHTMSHQDLCRVKEERAVKDLDQGKQTIERVAGIELVWFRAPYGVRCDRLERMMEERHLKHFHWDLDPQEWRHGNVDKTVKYVTGELSRAGGRVVLLMHDIKPVTVKALPQILDWIRDENKKRERSRKSKIRVLQANTLAAEQLPKGLVAWWKDATAGARALPSEIASVLP
ncbi:MAG TPA: polysaccharide deacetylase family protein [Kofleriaceae bacterium]|nr:polysaccharide deacetylase family protein [Kofleriaceae bacterium]